MLPAVLIALFGLELLLCAAVGWHFFGPTVMVRPGSAWLSGLPATPPVPTLTLYGTHDNLVLRSSRGALQTTDGARSEAWAALGHLSMLFSKPVAERVLAERGRAYFSAAGENSTPKSWQ